MGNLSFGSTEEECCIYRAGLEVNRKSQYFLWTDLHFNPRGCDTETPRRLN